jgi:hypothetical protein
VQKGDRLLQQVRACILEGRIREFTIDGTGAVRFHGHLCVPQKSEVKEAILREAHHTLYTVHPRDTKMYQTWKILIGGKKNESRYYQVCVNL